MQERNVGRCVRDTRSIRMEKERGGGGVKMGGI